jgi:signal transduction histidine kinase
MLTSGLILTYIFGIFCILITFSLGLFALIKGPKKAANISFFLLTISLDIYYISHLLGINAPNSEIARSYFMFNLANIFITTSLTHFIYAVFGEKTKGRTFMVWLAYGLGIGLFIFFISNPLLFMKGAAPKLYLPFYYVRGDFYWLLTAYFVFFATYIVVDLGRMYLKANSVERNRIKYIWGGIIWGYTVGVSALLLLYDVPVDPAYSMLFGLYSIPFAYAFLQYELLDIHIVAKRAFWYAISIATLTVLLVFINTANDFIVAAIPGFPRFIIPIISACVAVGIGAFVWGQIRDLDKLKYEFITIVTHKFRTPLTYIKWSLDNFSTSATEESRVSAVNSIQTAVSRLVELTDLLVSLEKTEDSSYVYTITKEDLSDLIKKTIEIDSARITSKQISLQCDFPAQRVITAVDKRRMEFALQIILENAISYTPEKGTVAINIFEKSGQAFIIIKDSGIGIAKEELPFIFTKFFRGSRARHVDTEGMGIGLFIAQDILRRHHGHITVSSEGEGKGSTFTITLPVEK